MQGLGLISDLNREQDMLPVLSYDESVAIHTATAGWWDLVPTHLFHGIHFPRAWRQAQAVAIRQRFWPVSRPEWHLLGPSSASFASFVCA